jgi:hypothetical protein
MIKKITGLALAIALFSTTPAFAATGVEKAIDAAPAIAVEILTEHGVQPSGDILKLVAKQMGPGSSFMGIEKDDPMYEHKVMHYLHCDLGVIEMEDHECMHHGMTE